MNLEYITLDPSVASTRLRCIIPARELQKWGITVGQGGTLIVMKHGFTWDKLPRHNRLIFDICDDHFSDHLSSHYRRGCVIADRITCNSDAMRDVIMRYTGRNATVIKEPYENKRGKPAIGDKLLWFGHANNLPQVQKLLPHLRHQISILSNAGGTEPWSPDTFRRRISEPCIVLLPTGDKMTKSENRFVEAIRCGRYVCPGFMPSYLPLYKYMPYLEIIDHVETALANKDKAIEAIVSAQDYIEQHYAPDVIAQDWLKVLEE